LQRLEQAGFRCYRPNGAYYIMTDISGFGFDDDLSFVRHMIENIGVAAVPGSSFFSDSNAGATLIRFCFCKKYETLKLASQQLMSITTQL
jgi:aminotransferase